MPSFASPFTGNINRKMTDIELMQALRMDIASELEAIFLYDSHLHATDNPMAREVLKNIRDEEKAHIGELVTLLCQLNPDESQHFMKGQREVENLGLGNLII